MNKKFMGNAVATMAAAAIVGVTVQVPPASAAENDQTYLLNTNDNIVRAETVPGETSPRGSRDTGTAPPSPDVYPYHWNNHYGNTALSSCTNRGLIGIRDHQWGQYYCWQTAHENGYPVIVELWYGDPYP